MRLALRHCSTLLALPGLIAALVTGGAAASPRDYLTGTLRLQGLSQGQELAVNNLQGYMALTRMQTPFGVRDARVVTVFLHQQAFSFFGAVRDAGRFAESDRDFLATPRSLHALRPNEQTLARGRHLELVTARPGDRFATLARRAHVETEPEAVLRLINGRYPLGEPVPGEYVKLIQ